jgi:release factor glutamine methyltransferase
MSAPLTESAIVSALRAAGCVFAEDEARLILSTARTPGDASAMVERRAAGEPLEHVLGWAWFCGLRIAVDSGVFVPRRRTEFLVRQAHALAAPCPVVVDLCCGTGALGAALASGLTEFELHAADIEPAAVRCARRNIAPFGGLAYEGDLFEPLPDALRGRVDVLLCNVPYVPTGDVGLMPAEARDHEPRVALDGGRDGLDVLRRVTAEASRWLAPGGHLLFETSERQVADAVAAVERGGSAATVATSEEFYATVVVGTKSV